MTAFIDFETYGFSDENPVPEPVGVAIYIDGVGQYYAFNHPNEVDNTHNPLKVKEELQKHIHNMCFHNAKFDLAVLREYFQLQPDSWENVHDTLFLAYLNDPREAELGLKPLAEKYLTWAAEERDELADWLITNQPIPGVRISASKKSDHYFGNYIAYAPVELVAKYAIGDVERTAALFDYFYPKIQELGMGEAYDRERKLLIVLLEMESHGVPVDHERLRNDVAMYEMWLARVEAYLQNWLSPEVGNECDELADELITNQPIPRTYPSKKVELNINSGAQFLAAAEAVGLANSELLPLTPTGKPSTKKDTLHQGITDPLLLNLYLYKQQLGTCLNTFMKPWLRMADLYGGVIRTTWNQTRSPADKGTRTGRLSSTPNFQNIPKKFENLFQDITLPRLLEGIPDLPNVRSYIVAFSGEVLVDADYNQQELRILGHYEDGNLCSLYKANPRIDLHQYAHEKLLEKGKDFDRKKTKTTHFLLIYGGGVPRVAEATGLSLDAARDLYNSILDLYNLREIQNDMYLRAKLGQPIRTWGGRLYYCEEPRIVNGVYKEFSYKMMNILNQGSAADCIKEALIRFYERKKPTWKILLIVHDQICASVPEKDIDEAAYILKMAMESVEFDVPMLVDQRVSFDNWTTLEPYTKPVQKIAAWSYSRYSTYKQCPLKAKLQYIDRLAAQQSEAMDRGKGQHKAIELYLSGQSEKLNAEFPHFRDYIADLKSHYFRPDFSGIKTLESQWAFNKDWLHVDWFSPQVWVRVILDCAYSVERECLTELVVIDWKTGKFRIEENNNYVEQLELQTLAAFKMYPQVDLVTPKLVYLDQGIQYPVNQNVLVYTRDDVEKLEQRWRDRTTPMLSDTIYAPRPNKFCFWCPFKKTDGGQCEY